MAEDSWALFAVDKDDAKYAASIAHEVLKNRIWIWTKGSIEDALSLKGKKKIEVIESETVIDIFSIQ